MFLIQLTHIIHHRDFFWWGVGGIKNMGPFFFLKKNSGQQKSLQTSEFPRGHYMKPAQRIHLLQGKSLKNYHKSAYIKYAPRKTGPIYHNVPWFLQVGKKQSKYPDNGNPTMENNPIMVDWDTGSPTMENLHP